MGVGENDGTKNAVLFIRLPNMLIDSLLEYIMRCC
jgi:hypothetical protein